MAVQQAPHPGGVPVARTGASPALRRFAPDLSLLRLQPWRALAALAADWGLIALALAAAMRWPHPLVFVLAAILIARTQLALAVLMHASAHHSLLPAPIFNDAVAQACAAGPLGLSLTSYRARHLHHHRAPLRADDGFALVGANDHYPVSRRALAARLLGELVGAGWLRRLSTLARGAGRDAPPGEKKTPACLAWELFSVFASNALLLAVLAWCGHPWFYLGLWIVPALTLLPVLDSIKSTMEHARLPASDHPCRSARTIVRPSWQTFLFGPHAIHYQLEHHLYPSIPFYQLGRLHRQMATLRLLPREQLHDGYGALLRELGAKQAHGRH